jgi:hypothetical protein
MNGSAKLKRRNMRYEEFRLPGFDIVLRMRDVATSEVLYEQLSFGLGSVVAIKMMESTNPYHTLLQQFFKY